MSLTSVLKQRWFLFCLAAGILAVTPSWAKKKHHRQPAQAHAQEHEAGEKKEPLYQRVINELKEKQHSLRKPGFVEVIEERVRIFWKKVQSLQKLDEENKELRERVAKLETELAKLRGHDTGKAEKVRAKKLRTQAKREGGRITSRTVSSLSFRDPAMISAPPRVVFEKGLHAFSTKDYETSAKAFVSLSENEENSAYQTAEVFYLAGVSLYELGNIKTARSYFDRSVSKAQGKDVAFAPRAMAWVAVCQAKLGDKRGEKDTVRDLIQRYPRSREARRLNRDG